MSSQASRRTSVVFNVVLAAVVVALGLSPSKRGAAALPPVARPTTTTAPAPPSTHAPRSADIASPSGRRRSIIDQLRAMGAPTDVLALVARADREREWEARLGRCQGDMNKLEALQLEKDLCQDAEMCAALGEKDFKEWDTRTLLWEAMSTEVETTPLEAEAIYAAKKQLQRRRLELQQARVNGTKDERELDAASEQADAEYNGQLKAAMGAEKYAKSQQLDEAFAAGNLRAALAKAAVNPSDAQFQELFRIEQRYSDAQADLNRRATQTPGAVDVAIEDKALNDARDQDYERVLGHDAFEALQKSQDFAYSQMKKYEAYWGLDDTKVDYVYHCMQQYRESVKELSAYASALHARGQNIDAINHDLQQLADQTQQILHHYLGADQFNRLQANRAVEFYPVFKLPARH